MKRIWNLLAAILLQACGGGGSSQAILPPPASSVSPDPSSASCSVDAQRASLDAWMQDQYYWYPQLAGPDLTAADMGTYFHSMLPNPPDRYSFAQSTESFDQVFVSGWRIGYGYTLVWDETGTVLRVRNVEPSSPVAAAGIRRGDRVLAIDGFTPRQVAGGALPSVSTPGVARTFLLVDAAGSQREVVVRSALYAISPLALSTTLDVTRGGAPVKVGYMAYNQFVAYSTWPIYLAISRMAAQGVGEFVLDLRYNGGGSVITARDLASMIGGVQTQGRLFAELRFNDKHPEQNLPLAFLTAQERIVPPLQGLTRFFVITSGGTASASEMLINGLKPFMRPVLVGERTYGKPYGFVARDNCGTTYNAVNFEIVNAQGVGGYSSGMPVDCQAPDDLDHALGDPQERRLKEALNYIVTGRCSAQAPQSAQLAPAARDTRVFGETVPPQMFLDK
jgi:C-terminal processing protease CtpA/Prc